MPSGTVAHFNEERGFGFIRPDDGGGDIFVHARNIANADRLTQGQRVSFEVVDDVPPRAASRRSGAGDLSQQVFRDCGCTSAG
jgi:CspA family cold shock protein